MEERGKAFPLPFKRRKEKNWLKVNNLVIVLCHVPPCPYGPIFMLVELTYQVPQIFHKKAFSLNQALNSSTITPTKLHIDSSHSHAPNITTTSSPHKPQPSLSLSLPLSLFISPLPVLCIYLLTQKITTRSVEK